MFPTAENKDVIKLTGFDEKLSKRDSLISEISQLEKEKKKIEQEIQIKMEDSEFAEKPSERIESDASFCGTWAGSRQLCE